jgi:hypothetical protein
MTTRILLTSLLVASAATAAVSPSRPKQQSRTDPPAVPLEARLVVKKGSYPLDFQGMTPEEFCKQFRLAPAARKQLILPPAVDLVLEVRNTGREDLKVWKVGGQGKAYDFGPGLEFDLKGPLVVSCEGKPPPFIGPEKVTLGPGKSSAVPIRSLSSTDYAKRGMCFWLKAGEYRLTVHYHTAVSPAPKGSQDAGDGFGHVTLTAAPATLEVTDK